MIFCSYRSYSPSVYRTESLQTVVRCRKDVGLCLRVLRGGEHGGERRGIAARLSDRWITDGLRCVAVYDSNCTEMNGDSLRFVRLWLTERESGNHERHVLLDTDDSAKAYITIAIRQQYDDTTTHPTTTKVMEYDMRSTRLQYDDDNLRFTPYLGQLLVQLAALLSCHYCNCYLLLSVLHVG